MILRSLSNFVKLLTENVPRNYTKFPTSGLVVTGESYVMNGIIHEEFAHEDYPGIRIIIDVDHNRVVSIKAGRHMMPL